MMFTQKGNNFWPDVGVHEKMDEVLLVDVINTTDGCDVVEMVTTILLADGPLM